MDLMKALQEPGPILMDGAMGTELEFRGAPMDGIAWSATAMASHPQLVREIHSDYLRAGAQIHIVNSFSLARHVLEPAGLGDQVESFNRLAVELCRAALEPATRPQWIAGSLSSFGEKGDRSKLPSGAVLAANYSEQATVLKEAGVDLFALEMLNDFEITKAMMAAVMTTGLPMILGFTCEDDGAGGVAPLRAMGLDREELTLDILLPRLLAEIPAGYPSLVAVMHCEFDVSDAALEVVQRHWQGPVAVYPNSGEIILPNCLFDTVCAPEVFADAAMRWVGKGVQIVGGCCGLGPSHLAALRDRLAA